MAEKLTAITIFALVHMVMSTVYNGVRVKPVSITLLTDTEDRDNEDEVSLWMQNENIMQYVERTGVGYNYWKDEHVQLHRVTLTKDNPKKTVNGKWHYSKGESIYMHLIEHDFFVNDATEWNDKKAWEKPEIDASIVNSWVESFNGDGGITSLEISYTFKLSTWGMDDIPFLDLLRAFGFPDWCIELALSPLCVDAFDVVLGGIGSKVGKSIAKAAYKNKATKAAGRFAIETATKKLFTSSGDAATEKLFPSMDKVLASTEFCLVDVSKKDDPYYRVDFVVEPQYITQSQSQPMTSAVGSALMHVQLLTVMFVALSFLENGLGSRLS